MTKSPNKIVLNLPIRILNLFRFSDFEIRIYLLDKESL